MNLDSSSLDANALRAQLMAPNPMQRVQALHALELELEHGPAAADTRLANEVERFAARGMPYYAPDDSHYRAWVDRAIQYWEKLQQAIGGANALAKS
jgi:hypothetical protein